MTFLLPFYTSSSFLRNPSTSSTSSSRRNTVGVRLDLSVLRLRRITVPPLAARSPLPPRATKLSLHRKERGRRELAGGFFPSRRWSDVPDGIEHLARAAVAAAALLCLGSGVSQAVAGDERGVPLSPYPCEDVAGYYSSLDGLGGAVLKRRLGAIVSVHRSLAYKEVWDALKILDAADPDNPEDSLDVIEIYSLRAVPKSLAGKPQGWNREHLWPRSYGLVDKTSLTDLYNLRPADVNVNSSRGNKYYGECFSESTDCLRPANSEAALDTEADSKRWAPPFEVRGDVARSLMYMAWISPA